MALRPVEIPVRFAGGIETSEDAKGVLPAKLLGLENGVFTKATSIVKRKGYEVMPISAMTSTGGSGGVLGRAAVSSEGGGGAAVSDGGESPQLGLGKRGTELLQFANGKGYSFSEAAQKWVDRGTCIPATVSRRSILRDGTNQSTPDAASVGDVTVVAWTVGADVYYGVEDETGQIIVAPTLLIEDASKPRVRAIDGNIVIFYAEAAGNLRARVLSPSLPAQVGGPLVIVTDLNTSTLAYDVDSSPDCAYAAVAWHDTSDQMRVGYVTGAGILGSPATDLPSPIVAATGIENDAGVAVALERGTATPDVGYAWAYDDGGAKTTRAARIEDDLATALLESDLFVTDETPDALTCAMRPGDDNVYTWAEYTTGGVAYVATARLDASSATTTAEMRGSFLASRAFVHEGYAYAHIETRSTFWATYYCIRDDGAIVTRVLSGLGVQSALTSLPQVWVEDDTARLVATAQAPSNSEGTVVYTEKWIEMVDINLAAKPTMVELGGAAYMVGGGFLWQYDGAQFTEAGFFYAPDDIPAPSTATAGAILAGTYNYIFVYEWPNAQGEWERGPISVAEEVENAGSKKVIWSGASLIPTLRHSYKSGVRIGVFRSEDGDASAYYRVSSLDPSATGDNGYLANDPDADGVAFTDNMLDSVLITREPLYTNGGIRSNDGWESGSVICAAKGRVFTSDATSPDRVRFSQERAEGFALEQAGEESAGELSIPCGSPAGAVTGIAEMDDTVVIFKANAILRVAGPGPLANPSAGGGFSAPQLVTTDVGCTDGRLICQCPVGLLFFSAKGWRLLGRDFQVRPIGDPVEAYNDQAFTAATLINDQEEIRILASSGQTLLWDYGKNQWSTFTRHAGIDAALVGGIYHYMRADGEVWKQADTYLDGTGNISMAITTAWIKLAGHLQGFQKIWTLTVLGEYKSAHTLTVRAAYDYEPGWTNEWTIDPADFIAESAYGDGDYGDGVYGGTSDTRYQFTIHIGQPCEAVRFYFADKQAAGAGGASFELTEMVIRGGMKLGNFKVENARSY